MSVVLDTSLLVGAYDSAAPEHEASARWLRDLDEELVTTPLAIAEMESIVRRRGGLDAQRALWSNLDAGAVTVRWWADAMDETVAIARRRPEISLVDASLVALAHRVRTDRVATFDHTHFRTLKTRDGKPFQILPADA
ncbi:MAG TPA: PIN domain-containing protein [Solirubrobacteraceae bacterium]|nr:PIN domain-containing protein [Solirubrobacteraceae bacterium]